MNQEILQQTLVNCWPFVYLTPEKSRILGKSLTITEYRKGQQLYDINNTLAHTYLLLQGTVKSYQLKDGTLQFGEEVSENTLLGDRFVLLNQTTTEKIVAATDIICALITKQQLQTLIQQNPRFGHAIARSLRQKQAIFDTLEHFCARIAECKAKGFIAIEQIIDDYKQMSPALHPKANHSELDEGAWSYALHRLPEDLNHTHVYLLTPMPPPVLAGTRALSMPISSKARRRTAWKLSPGKTLVVLRDAHTDLFDFVTNLCIHAVESQKIRRAIHSSELVDRIYQAINNQDPTIHSELQKIYGKQWDAFCRLFPDNTLQQLWDLIVHHEDYSLYIEKSLHAYDTASTEKWADQLREAAKKLIGDINSIPVHIISSNTFGVRNCLHSHVHKNKNKILEWGKTNQESTYNATFPNPIDRLYALLPAYIKNNTQFFQEMQKQDEQSGIVRLKAEGFTGIDVELIATHKLDGINIDPTLQNEKPFQKQLIVNIDYAFGSQAEDIIGCLILVFGSNIRSINIMGKAGALTGKRGDILQANAVLMERSDNLYPVPNQNVNTAALAKDSGRSVHEGAVLTVLGTLLQNKALLSYYKNFWHCVGLEMEGSFYARQILRARALTLISQNTDLRFLYFVSDLPLQENETLAKDMSPHEFTSPLYAITRSFLRAILQ